MESDQLARLSNGELRQKLLEHGVDIPSSVSKEFMIKKLIQKGKEGPPPQQQPPPSPSPSARGGGNRRRTMGTHSSQGPVINNNTSVLDESSSQIPRSRSSRGRLSTPARSAPPATATPPQPPEVKETPAMKDVRARKSLGGGGRQGTPRSSSSGGGARNSTLNNVSLPTPPPRGGGGGRSASPGRRKIPAGATATYVGVARNMTMRTSTRGGGNSIVDLNTTFDVEDDEEQPMEGVEEINQNRSLMTKAGRRPVQVQTPPPSYRTSRSSTAVSPAKRSRVLDNLNEDDNEEEEEDNTRRSSFLGLSSPFSWFPSPGGSSASSTPSPNNNNTRRKIPATSTSVAVVPPTFTSRSKFSVIVDGRRIQTECLPNPQRTKFIFEIPDAESIQYITIFLNEGETFEPGCGSQIFFGWPDERNAIKWDEIGHISNMKPSGIFNVAGIKEASRVSRLSRPSTGRLSNAYNNNSSNMVVAQIGISYEKLDEIKPCLIPNVQLV